MTFPTSLRLHVAALVVAAVALLAAGAASGASTVARDVSSNWAGYVVSGASFTSVSGTWVQPVADCTSTGPGAAASGSLEQAGTTAECTADGTAVYWAWYELVPAAAVKIPLEVMPGDTISATVTVSGTKVTMQVKNLTRRTAVTKTKTMAYPDTSSAEWIAEAPSWCATTGACRIVTLADFGTVKFTSASATGDGHTGTIADRAWSATSVQLLSELGGPSYGRYAAAYTTAAEAVPTVLSARGSAFSVKRQGSTAAETPPAPSWP